jgi:hypothetical protein
MCPCQRLPIDRSIVPFPQHRIEQCDAQRRRFIAQQLELSAQVSSSGNGNGNGEKVDGFGFDATAKADDRARLRLQVRLSDVSEDGR